MAKREGLLSIDADCRKGCGICLETCPTNSLQIGSPAGA
jgi:Pyruvate/2-oxoacid:ferredoxin oxidoreductase delta subunit